MGQHKRRRRQILEFQKENIKKKTGSVYNMGLEILEKRKNDNTQRLYDKLNIRQFLNSKRLE